MQNKSFGWQIDIRETNSDYEMEKRYFANICNYCPAENLLFFKGTLRNRTYHWSGLIRGPGLNPMSCNLKTHFGPFYYDLFWICYFILFDKVYINAFLPKFE